MQRRVDEVCSLHTSIALNNVLDGGRRDVHTCHFPHILAISEIIDSIIEVFDTPFSIDDPFDLLEVGVDGDVIICSILIIVAGRQPYSLAFLHLPIGWKSLDLSEFDTSITD